MTVDTDEWLTGDDRLTLRLLRPVRQHPLLDDPGAYETAMTAWCHLADKLAALRSQIRPPFTTAAWSIVLPDYLPLSMNEREGFLTAFKGKKSMPWRVQKEKELAADALAPVLAALQIPPALGPRRVRFEFRKGYRTRSRDDPGNLGARMKAPLDVLVKLGQLVDDNDRWLLLDLPVETKGDVATKAGPQTTITIEDAWTHSHPQAPAPSRRRRPLATEPSR